MHSQQRTLTVRVDTYTRVCLTAIAVLLTVLVIGLWANGPELAQPAEAQAFVNASAQRETIIGQIQQTNAKLDKLIVLMSSGKARVQVVEAGQTPGEPNAHSPKTKP